jgi:dipeptidyl-peptidase-4
MRRALLLTALAMGSVPALHAQGAAAPLSIDSMFNPAKKVAYAGMPKARLAWASDGALIAAEHDKNGVAFLKVDPKTWKKTPLFDAGKLQAALVAAGADAKDASAALGSGQFRWNAARTALVLSVADDLYLVDLAKVQARRLTTAPGEEIEPTFSPDGAKVAFLRGRDLYMVTTGDAKETRLTTGGDETHLNGRLNWVYQEEVYGRGDFKGFWWAPDSSKLAYLSLDESKVPVYTLADDRAFEQKLLQARYPKAGDPNPIARLGVVDLDGHTTWTTDPYNGAETLIVRVDWTPQGQLMAAWMNRVQTWLDLRTYEGASSKAVIHEQTKAWVDTEHTEMPEFLPDGGFLWQSDRTGHHHIYRYGKDGALMGAVTSGDWDVKALFGVDAKAKHIYFSADARSPISVDAYRADLGKAPNEKMTLLTAREGSHRVSFDPKFRYFLDTWSDIRTPPQMSLLDAEGSTLRVIDANPASEAWKQQQLGEISFLTVPTRDGFPMDAMLIKPVGFDPAKKYPVFQHIYGGPAAPQVANAWNREMPWFQFLAQQGYLVWVCDNRSATAKGIASAYGIFKNFGAQELQDQLDGLKWLGQQGYADMDRVCLEGWSYGGFMTSYSLTHSTAYKLGIVGAPVTDWHLYDSIYTERYMDTPQANPEGYKASSVDLAAKDLHGKVLIMHGTSDDNVHPANTIQLIQALQNAGKDYEIQLFPGSDHGSAFGKPMQAWAIYRARWAFIKANL